MQNQIGALIVSGRLENRQKLSRILENLPTNVFIVGTLAHAQEVLQEQPISVVFCDERMSDGPYSELVAFARSQRKSVQFIVMLSTGEWPEFQQAVGLGADVVRCPLQPSDVELALIHAMRKDAVTSGTRNHAAPA
jgi:DNA-binding NtrC family response regulator